LLTQVTSIAISFESTAVQAWPARAWIQIVV
jgi:hypothetical protein